MYIYVAITVTEKPLQGSVNKVNKDNKSIKENLHAKSLLLMLVIIWHPMKFHSTCKYLNAHF